MQPLEVLNRRWRAAAAPFRKQRLTLPRAQLVGGKLREVAVNRRGRREADPFLQAREVMPGEFEGKWREIRIRPANLSPMKA